MAQHIRTLPGLDQRWTQRPTPQQCCTKCYGLANSTAKKVSATLCFSLQRLCETFCCICFYQSALCTQCAPAHCL